MFTRYQYTCPDVIHMRKMRRNYAIAYTAAYAVFCAVVYVWSVSVEDNTEPPETTEEI